MLELYMLKHKLCYIALKIFFCAIVVEEQMVVPDWPSLYHTTYVVHKVPLYPLQPPRYKAGVPLQHKHQQPLFPGMSLVGTHWLVAGN